jgi:undecaprenyl phosphate N,N'-diacetylbacillosamine 1-phosphate transferase
VQSAESTRPVVVAAGLPATRAGKRALDILGAGIGLALLAPLLLVVAVLIVLDDPGPIFFRQSRLGRGGTPFRIVKFRTMRIGAPDPRNADGSSVTFAVDPRLTRLGALLRRSSIDELPQLMNVLIGDMSLVGPRPDQTDQLHFYGAGEARKLAVRPGITGLSQVLGRNSRSWRERKRLDRFYVDHLSLRLDCWILLHTVRAVVRPDGIVTERAVAATSSRAEGA